MQTQKLLLVVEDDKALRTALVSKLTHEGFSVAEAVDGADGLDKAFSLKPHLILLDLLMPKMDGTSMMDKIRVDDWGKHVPIIILTNCDADDEILGKVVKDQPSYYCLKADTLLEDLVQKINSVLDVAAMNKTN